MALTEILPPVMPQEPEDATYTLDVYRDSSGRIQGAYINDQIVGRVISVQQNLEQGQLVAVIATRIDQVRTNPMGFAPAPEEFTVGQPENITVQTGSNFIILTWEPPIDTNAIPITGYEVSIMSALERGHAELWRPASSMTGHTFTGLSSAIPYAISVRAVTATGFGEHAHVTVTPAASGGEPPTAPRNFKGVAGDGQVVLSWQAPLHDGGSPVLSFEVSSDNGTSWIDAFGMSGHTFSSLVNDTQYVFTVRAKNAIGAGDIATIVATPHATVVVQPVTNVQLSDDGTNIVLTWTPVTSPDAEKLEGLEIRAQLTTSVADPNYLVLDEGVDQSLGTINLTELFDDFFAVNPTEITTDDYYIVVVSDPVAAADMPAYAVTSATVSVVVTAGVGVTVSL